MEGTGKGGVGIGMGGSIDAGMALGAEKAGIPTVIARCALGFHSVSVGSFGSAFRWGDVLLLLRKGDDVDKTFLGDDPDRSELDKLGLH